MVATVMFAGASFAEASFLSDPSLQGNGITSIGENYTDANDSDSLNADIPNPGDTQEFYVFIDYQNGGNTILTNVRAYIERSGSSSIEFEGKLTAGNNGSEIDSATLTGLPSSWDIELLSTRKVVQHSQCPSQYNYNESVNGIESVNGALIGTLDTYGISSTNGHSGGCSQGHIVANYKITNTSSGGGTYHWETGPWGSCINGQQERDVYCVSSSTGNEVSDSFCDPSDKPDEVQNCSTGDLLDVDTEAPSNVDNNSATLNGDLISGGPADTYYFAISSTSSNPTCDGPIGLGTWTISASNIGGGTNPNFSADVTLVSGNNYFYRACASRNGDVDGGQVYSINNDDNGGDDEPEADTENPDNVEEDSAELKGSIRMNDYNNGEVFFVYGQDENRIEDVESDYDEYDDVQNDEDSDDFEVVLLESNHDEDDWEDFEEEVSSLEENERYYYQICVGYNNGGNDEITCGGVEEFDLDEENDDNDDNDGDVEIETNAPDDIGSTFAILCGDLEDDGGDDSLRTRIEVRNANGGSWEGGNFVQRGEGPFCVEVNNLSPYTDYQYRACTDEGDCGNVRYFRTNSDGNYPGYNLNVNTLPPSYVNTNSAILNGKYQGSGNDATQVWFEWGSTQSLGNQKRVYTKQAVGGVFSDPFTQLRACTNYYYRAVAQNDSGTVYGNIYSFRTDCIVDIDDDGPQIVVVEDVEETNIDLDSLGLGLSLIRLEIDDEQEAVFRGQSTQYEVNWENISTLDLDNIDVKVTIPRDIEVVSFSRGRFDTNENTILFTIDELDEGEEGSMTISGVVQDGTLGSVITAEAAAAYDNPVNEAQENAIDYDINEFVLNTNFGTASVFGLSNITFLGWLTILLGLLIIFLIARYIYLEREELRAQAYANGYRPNLYADPRYDYQRGPAPLGSGQHDPHFDSRGPDQAPRGNDDHYQPYRPNRG